MKIIFLDIDGVLNSRRYDAQRTQTDGNIDPACLTLLASLVKRTGARIVLTSSWRTHWDPCGNGSDAVGRSLAQIFSENGTPLFSKTPVRHAMSRSLEIAAWMALRDDIEAFVILDDMRFGWGRLEPFLVRTDYNIGCGLGASHVDRAAAILGERQADEQ